MLEIYTEIEKFIQDLRSRGHDDYAKAIVDARESGTMASEILGLVLLELKKSSTILKKDNPDLFDKAKILIEEINKYFENY